MKKLTSVDYLRAFSMLYIVAYWHSLGYAGVAFGQTQEFMWVITAIIMTLFVFISGYLIGGHKSRQMGATSFYKRRLLRIYPLYALAVALYYWIGIGDGWTMVKSLLGLSMYMEPPPLTLWFITMLLLFYAVTPLLLRLVENPVRFIGLVGSLIFMTLVMEVTLGTVDLRVALYLPAFACGIYCANHGISNSMINPRWALLAMPAAVILSAVNLPLQTLDFLKTAPLILLAAYLIFFTCYRFDSRFKHNSLIAFLSYSSFSMYLFHRPVFEAMKSLYFPSTTMLQVLYLTTLCVVIIALVSWCLQRLYDLGHQAVSVRAEFTGSGVQRG
jgi:peptidoglycan/LPS O-acetylase OafA/YrhL